MPRIQKKQHTLNTPRTYHWSRDYGTPWTILDLPAELIFYVLEAAHDSNDLFSLILTAPIFASIWKLHTASVSAKVLAHSIECYPSARELDLAVFPLAQQTGLAPNNTVAEGFYETVQSHKRILELDRCVDAFHTLFLEDCIDDSWDSYYDEAPIGERQRTKTALYYMWRLVKTSTYGPKEARNCPVYLPPDLIDPKLCDTLATVEIMSWMFHCHFGHTTSNVRLDRLFSRAHRIYGPTDRVRWAQSCRWIACCYTLWESRAHRQIRQKCWDALDMPRKEPVSLGWLWENRRGFLTVANIALEVLSY